MSMRGSREILQDSESKLLNTIESVNSDVSELLLLAEKVLLSAKAMEKEASSVIEQVQSQATSGRKKAKLAFSEKNEDLAREALRQSITIELESERLASHSSRLQLLTAELSRWHQDLKGMQESLASWAKLWREKRGRAVILPSVSVLGRMVTRMIRASSVIDKVEETADILKVDIEGLEKLRAEAEPGGETFGWKYKMSADLKTKIEGRLQEELVKLQA
jgi:hypothetical protein